MIKAALEELNQALIIRQVLVGSSSLVSRRDDPETSQSSWRAPGRDLAVIYRESQGQGSFLANPSIEEE